MNEMSFHLAKQPPSRERPVAPHGGIFHALNESKRVVDLQTARLPLSVLKEWAYMLRRHREAAGKRTTVIDCMASGKTTADLRDAFFDQYRNRYGVQPNGPGLIDRVIELVSRPIEHVMLDLPEAGCCLAIISSQQDFFIKDFHQPDNELWLMDWSDLVGLPPREVLHPENHLIVTGFSGFST